MGKLDGKVRTHINVLEIIQMPREQLYLGRG